MADKNTHLGRYRRIADVLLRHGLGYMVGVSGLERFVPPQKELLGYPRREEPYTRPEHLRLALEELGATFIKLGQFLTTRPDLMPPDYQEELARLQDSAPTVAREYIEQTIAAELGSPGKIIFADFEEKPLAAASIGQAHAATLKDGSDVIVKVRRPGVVEQVEADLEILRGLAATASRRWEVAEDYDVVGLMREFSETLRAELDYIREGRSAERFAKNFAGDPDVHIPEVFWETSTSRLLTLERIRGIKISDVEALDSAGMDRRELAERASRVILKMVFEDGFFHADPHPGNFFVEDGGVIGLVDFGMVGTVDEPTQERLASLLTAVTAQDPDQLVDELLELGVAKRRVDRNLLRQDISRLLSRYYGRTLGEIRLGELIEEALAVMRRHRLQVPTNLNLLLKALMMCEGMGTRLDPAFNLTTVLVPYAEQLMSRRYAPGALARQLGQAGVEAAELGAELPRSLRRLMGELERGNLEVGMRPEGLEPVLRRFERLANRLVLGMIAAAFIVGLAVLMAVYHPPGWEGLLGRFFAFGFLLAGGLGLYLAWSILRSGRR